MAFLSTTDRFGPDLDKCQKIRPNPSTYEPVNATIADGAPFHTSSRYGTIGPHYDVPMARKALASPAAKILAAVHSSPASIHSQRRKAPTPWHYTPTVDGQFARVYTVEDLEKRRRQRIEAAKRTSAARSKGSGDGKPEEVQHLALGPGTYEVDKDWNLEAVAVPFRFSKARRNGIVDCSMGGKDLHSDSRRVEKYARGITADQRRRSETALLPLRRPMTNDPHEVAALSKELAKSYAELQRSTSRIERKLSSPVIREAKFQRFDEGKRDVESFRRGPGSYFDEPSVVQSTLTAEGDDLRVMPSLDDDQKQQLEALLTDGKGTASTYTRQTKKKTSTFGLVKHRDMLTSMHRAGHLSAVAVEDTLGPGVYETTTSSFHEPSHNLMYKAGLSRKTTVSSNNQRATSLVNREDNHSEQDVRKRWLALRRGPTIPPTN